jgi:hypothetical protein
MTLCQSLSEQL